MLYYSIGAIEQAEREYYSMGQYQQWLQHRETEQQLQITQATLERELNDLQERVFMLEQAYCYAENPIIEVLAASQQEPTASHSPETNGAFLADAYVASSEAAVNNGALSEIASGNGNSNHLNVEVISPALQAWGKLPNFDAPNAPQHFQPDDLTSDTPFDQSLPPVPHSEMDLLPDDMVGFFDSHTLTEPQLELPWWLRNVAPSSYTAPTNGPVDQESIRTNRLVQRWLERWGRQAQQADSPQHKPGGEPL